MKYPFQGPGIGYPVVELTHDIIALYASSIVVRGRVHISGHHASIQPSRSHGMLDKFQHPSTRRKQPQLAFKSAKICRTGIELVRNLGIIEYPALLRSGDVRDKRDPAFFSIPSKETERACRPGLP